MVRHLPLYRNNQESILVVSLLAWVARVGVLVFTVTKKKKRKIRRKRKKKEKRVSKMMMFTVVMMMAL